MMLFTIKMRLVIKGWKACHLATLKQHQKHDVKTMSEKDVQKTNKNNLILNVVTT